MKNMPKHAVKAMVDGESFEAQHFFFTLKTGNASKSHFWYTNWMPEE